MRELILNVEFVKSQKQVQVKILQANKNYLPVKKLKDIFCSKIVEIMDQVLSITHKNNISSFEVVLIRSLIHIQDQDNLISLSQDLLDINKAILLSMPDKDQVHLINLESAHKGLAPQLAFKIKFRTALDVFRRSNQMRLSVLSVGRKIFLKDLITKVISSRRPNLVNRHL